MDLKGNVEMSAGSVKSIGIVLSVALLIAPVTLPVRANAALPNVQQSDQAGAALREGRV